MPYTVKSIFGPTLQGEGPHAGAPCLFVRLGGCNAWDGKPETRATSACPYCDTDFRGGDRLELAEIGLRLHALIPKGVDGKRAYGCVLSGGEPLLQTDVELLRALGGWFAWVDVETNGTRAAPPRPSNVTIVCSPKKIANHAIVVEPDCWKVLIPDQQDFLPQVLATGKPVFVQPTCPDAGPHGPVYEANLKQCIELCRKHGCRLSLQLHKYLGLE